MRKVIYSLVAFQLGRMTYQAGAEIRRWDDETKIDCFYLPAVSVLAPTVAALLIVVAVMANKIKELKS